MRVQITTRSVDVPEDVQTRTRELVEKLERFDGDILSADVVFMEEKFRRRIEAILSIANDEPVVASSENEEWLTAADVLSDRLAKILRRRRGRREDRQTRGARSASEGI